MDLSDENVQQLSSLITETLNEQNRMLWVDRKTHHNHHEWIAEEMSRRDEQKAFRRKVIQSVTIWAVIIVVAFVAVSVWQSVVESLSGGGS